LPEKICLDTSQTIFYLQPSCRSAASAKTTTSRVFMICFVPSVSCFRGCIWLWQAAMFQMRLHGSDWGCNNKGTINIQVLCSAAGRTNWSPVTWSFLTRWTSDRLTTHTGRTITSATLYFYFITKLKEILCHLFNLFKKILLQLYT